MISSELPQNSNSERDERTASINRRSRRARIASLVAGAAGLPAMMAGTFAKPASAESFSGNNESPQALVASIKQEVSQAVAGADEGHELLLPERGYDDYAFVAPNPSSPNVHDQLMITLTKNGKLAYGLAGIVLFTDIEDMKEGKNPLSSFSQMNFRPDARGHADMNALELHTATKNPLKVTNYLISDRPGLPKDIYTLSGKDIDYSADPEAVKKGYGDFLTYVKGVIEHSLTKQQIIEVLKKTAAHH